MNFDKYKVNISSLGDNLLNGVSGLMRVKNEDEFLSLSIDSCIDALDELIIVYQESSDNTEFEILKKKEQYPQKIKVFKYEPEIKSHNLTIEQFESLKKLPKDSINLLSNYYNYTLSKASYRFALKIDADQIYNSVKLKEICDAYRKNEKVKISIYEHIAATTIKLMSAVSFQCINRLHFSFLPSIPKNWFYRYYNYCLKQIQNKKITSSFMGVNLYLINNNAYLPIGNYEQNTFPPFNGIDDHLIFEISNQSYFISTPIKSKLALYKNCIIERFSLNSSIYKPFGFGKNLVNCGFLWYHVAPLKKEIYYKTKDKYANIIVPLQNTTYNKLKESLSIKLFYRQNFWFKLYWSNWNRQKITEIINWNKILKKIIEHNENSNINK